MIPQNVPLWGINPTTDIEAPLPILANEGYKDEDSPSVEHFNYFYFVLTQFINAAANGELSALVPYATIADLKAVDTTDLANNSTVYIKDIGGYMLDKSASNLADDLIYISPDSGGGRWKLLFLDPNAIFAFTEPYFSDLSDRIDSLESPPATILKGSATYTVPSLTTNTETTFTITVTGAVSGNFVQVNSLNALSTGLLIVSSVITANNTVTVKIRNITASTIGASTSNTFYAIVFK